MKPVKISVTVQQAIAINSTVTGMSLRVVTDSVKIGMLDSALQAPFAGFGDLDVYRTAHERLGVLCSRIVRNHPFLDGNKRTGFIAMLMMAHLNGIAMLFPDEDAVSDQIEGVAAGEIAEEDFCAWLVDYIAEAS